MEQTLRETVGPLFFALLSLYDRDAEHESIQQLRDILASGGITEVLLETGLRSGELLNLTPDQVIEQQVEDEDGTDVPVGVILLRKGKTKNNKSRPVILPVELAREIRALIAAGGMPKGDRLLDVFKSACERAGYTGNLVIHSLRHTRNTRLFKAGVDKAQRKEIIGHMSDEANEIYTHLDLEDQLQAVKKVREYAGKKASRAKQAPTQVVDFPKRGAVDGRPLCS
jgi:integrase